MGALEFWNAVVEDRSNFLERVIRLLEESGLGYRVISGVAVNAYAEPLVTQDLNIVVAKEQLAQARALLEQHFNVREFEHSLNVYDPDSKLHVQLQLNPRIANVLGGATAREVMGLRLPVASPADLLQATAEAAMEPTCRPSKRGKDLLDIARLVTVFPELRENVPDELKPRVAELVDADEAQ